MRAWRGQGAALGLSGAAGGQDRAACGASSVRPSQQRGPAQRLPHRRRKHRLGQGSLLPTPQLPARSSSSSHRLTKVPSPLLSPPAPGGGTVAQHSPDLPPQPDTAREQRGRGRARQGGSERCREGEREAEGRGRGTGRRRTPPAAGKGLALPPAAERRALTATAGPPVAQGSPLWCDGSLGAPHPPGSSGSAGPPPAPGGA